MRHGNKNNHLGRKTGHRNALLANLACSLILHKRIETTLAKAKALRVYVEPLITKSKDDTTHSRRTVFSNLKNKYAVKELFGTIAEKVANRPGGYTRVLKIGFRLGDAAEMAMIELVDFNETYTVSKKTAAKKTTRRSGGSKKATTTAAETTPAAEAAEATPAAVEEVTQAEEVPAVEEAPAAAAPAEEVTQAEEIPAVEEK